MDINDILINYVDLDNLKQYNKQTISYVKKLIRYSNENGLVTLKNHIADTDVHMTTDKNTNLVTAYDHSQAQHARVDATKVEYTRVLNSGTKIGSIKINDAAAMDIFSPEIIDNLSSTAKDKSLSANMGNKLNSNISDLDTKINDLIKQTDDLKKSVSDSKNKVASAITSMGIQTSSDATYDTIINNIKSIGANCTATAGDIISGKTAYVQGKTITGNMANRGNISKTLNPGGSLTLDPGYYSGGTITITSLSSSTSATASAGDLLNNKTAWVNGNKIIGSMPNNGNANATLNAGASKTLSAGYYSGGTISANSLSSQTSATALAGDLLSGKTAWVNGSRISGTMVNRGYLNKTLSPGGSLTISSGYYSGGTITVSGTSSGGGSSSGGSSLSPITDLRVSSTTSNSITLNFTKPSNADVYLYYSTSSSVNNTNYDSYRTWVSGISGSTVSFENLTSGRTYYFCAYVKNSSGSLSTKSNVVSATPSSSSSGGSSSSSSDTLYLYNRGDECTSITGGWEFYGTYNSNTYTPSNEIANKSSGYIDLVFGYETSGTQNHYTFLSVQTKNDVGAVLRKYKYINIECSYVNYYRTTEIITFNMSSSKSSNGIEALATLYNKQAVNEMSATHKLSYNPPSGGYKYLTLDWYVPQLIYNDSSPRSTLTIYKIYLTN